MIFTFKWPGFRGGPNNFDTVIRFFAFRAKTASASLQFLWKSCPVWPHLAAEAKTAKIGRLG